MRVNPAATKKLNEMCDRARRISRCLPNMREAYETDDDLAFMGLIAELEDVCLDIRAVMMNIREQEIQRGWESVEGGVMYDAAST